VRTELARAAANAATASIMRLTHERGNAPACPGRASAVNSRHRTTHDERTMITVYGIRN
jgi:hypothetical protein